MVNESWLINFKVCPLAISFNCGTHVFPGDLAYL